MTIEKEHGKYIVSCDLCGDILPVENTHNAARSAAKQAGWQFVCVDSTIENYCTECREDSYDNNSRRT